jgi:hypothetical protein
MQAVRQVVFTDVLTAAKAEQLSLEAARQAQ